MFIVPTCLLECALAIYKPELLWSPSISPGAEPAPPQLFPILINVSDAQVRKTGGVILDAFHGNHENALTEHQLQVMLQGYR